MKKLSTEAFAPLCSEYLLEGISRERASIASLEYDRTVIIARCDIAGGFNSRTDQNQFHLSAPMALVLTSQLRIIHGHLILEAARKDFEVFMGRIEFDFLKPIRKQEGILVRLTLVESVRKPSQSNENLIRQKLTWAIDIEDSSFVGKATSHFTQKIAA